MQLKSRKTEVAKAENCAKDNFCKLLLPALPSCQEGGEEFCLRSVHTMEQTKEKKLRAQ